MAIIYSYPEPAINVGMRLIGSDTTITGNPTININIGSLAEFILAYFNNSGTPNTHAMFITSTTIGDSYINQTVPTATTAWLSSNENHEMVKYLQLLDNLYVGDAGTPIDKALFYTQDTTFSAQNFTVSTSVSQLYYGTETHYGAVTFNNDVTFGSLPTVNTDQATFYHQLSVKGNLLDFNDSPGAVTQILSSDGARVEWIDQLASGLVYQGIWNANTNDTYPGSLASGVGTPGHYWIVSTPGATNLDGFNSWQIGDWAVFSSANVWQEIDNSAIFAGAGTPNTMTKWTGVTALGDSQSTDDGTNITMSAAGLLSLGGAAAVGIDIGNSVASSIEFTNVGNISVNPSVGTWRFNTPEVSFSPGTQLIDAAVSAGTAGQVLSSTGVQVEWIDVTAAAGALSGSGTLNYIPKWTPSGTELGNSVVFDDGTDLTAAVANDITFTALNDIYLGAKNDVDIEGEGRLQLYNLGSAVTDHISLFTHDALGYDQSIKLWNNNTGLDIDVNLCTITTTTDLVLNAGAGLKTSAASYSITTGPLVFDNASVRFNEPIIDQGASTGAAGNILKNDGTGRVNWGAPTWTQEAKIFEVSATVTAAELLNIAVVPKIILPALGANLVIQVVAMNASKAAGVAYDFPEALYAVENSLIGISQAKQTLLSEYWTNTVSLTNVTCNAVASGSWVDGAYRYGLTLAGNQDLVLTQDGLNATVGSGDLTVVVYYRKLDLTTMEFLPS